jgi:hypothetical protein
MNPSARLLATVCTLSIGLGLSGCSPTSGKSWGAGGGSVSRTENGATVSYTVQWLMCDNDSRQVAAEREVATQQRCRDVELDRTRTKVEAASARLRHLESFDYPPDSATA